jgi:leucyl aminopeptidase (aminopeptidase T)
MPETPETTMRPEDVPDALVAAAADAHEEWQADNCTRADLVVYRASHEAWVRAALAAVLPAHEAMVRAKVDHEWERLSEQVDRVRELLSDYGTGFVAAGHVLDVLDGEASK